MRAVDRIFSIFDAFDIEHQKLTLQEISERVGLSKATTFRLVNSLDHKGYLIRLADQRYCLSMKLLRLAGVVAHGLSVRDVARSVLVELAAETGETVSLNTAMGSDRVCVDVVESTARLMHIVTLGEHAPLLYGATGKVLLAHLEDAKREAIVKTLPRTAAFTQTSLRGELAEIRKVGYSVTSGERVPGSFAISVALYDMNNHVEFCLTVTAPAARAEGQEKRFLELMLAAQRDVSLKMGSTAFIDS